MQGKVIKMLFERAFGFISPDDGTDDIFFHGTECVSKFSEIVEGDAVSYEVADGKAGRQMAIKVTLVPKKENSEPKES